MKRLLAWFGRKRDTDSISVVVSDGSVQCLRCLEQTEPEVHINHRCPEPLPEHAAHCGPARGFSICYCSCPECHDGKKCICPGCEGHHQ